MENNKPTEPGYYLYKSEYFEWIGRMLSSCVTNEDSDDYNTYLIDNLKIT